MKKILFILVTMISVMVSYAQTYTTIAPGNWSSTSTWLAGAVPPPNIGPGATVNINHRVIYNLSNDLEIAGKVFITGDTLRFPNVASAAGQGRSIKVLEDGVLSVINGGLIMPIFLTNGAQNNGNIINDKGYVRFQGSYLELGQNYSSTGTGIPNDGGRRFTNSCMKIGESYQNSQSFDTLQTVCIEIGLHGSGNFSNDGGTINTAFTSVLHRGNSGNFSNSSGSTIKTFGTAAFGFQAIRLTGGSLSNSGTWTTPVNKWCATGGSSGSFTPPLPPQDCAFFTANNNFFSSCRDCGPQNAPLPVEFKSFTTTRNHSNVLLKWETASETNNKGFNVQRKINGEWKNISFVFSAAQGGNSYNDLSYSYNDVNITKGLSQYRIQQVDIDNRTSYSDIRSVRGEESSAKLLVYPNPSNDGKINVVFEDQSAKSVIVRDMSGRMVKQFKNVENNLAIENLESGMYSIQVTDLSTAVITVEKVFIKKR